MSEQLTALERDLLQQYEQSHKQLYKKLSDLERKSTASLEELTSFCEQLKTENDQLLTCVSLLSEQVANLAQRLSR